MASNRLLMHDTWIKRTWRSPGIDTCEGMYVLEYLLTYLLKHYLQDVCTYYTMEYSVQVDATYSVLV